MAEDGREEVAGVGDLEFAVGGIDVELRDLDRQFERGEAVELGENGLGAGRVAPEVCLLPDAPNRGVGTF